MLFIAVPYYSHISNLDSIMPSLNPPDLDSSSSASSEHGLSDHSPLSTNASTPPNISSLDLTKLSHDAAGTGGVVEHSPVNIAKNICCVGAGYVGMQN